MNVLGVHDGHNASVALLCGGTVACLAQEERFSGIKNQGGFPYQAVAWALRHANVDASEIDSVVLGQWSKTSAYTREEILDTYRRAAHSGAPGLGVRVRAYRNAALRWAGIYERLKVRVDYEKFGPTLKALSNIDASRVTAVDHHTAHAAAAYYGAHFSGEPALVLTLDGQGDGLCATVSVGTEEGLHRIAATPAGHSIGDIYARVTHLLGMVPLEHEYKLMGLAPYADRRRAEEVCQIFREYVEVDGLVFRRKVREPTTHIGGRLRRDLSYCRFDDVAAGLQQFTEERILDWTRAALRFTGLRKVCLGGGSFMNVKANGLIAQLDEVDDIFVCPSCGDESLSLGAAYHRFTVLSRKLERPAPLDTLYLGPSTSKSEVVRILESEPGLEIETSNNLVSRVAQLLANGEIIARCAGRTEFGARALGNRSILADPSRPSAIQTLNQAIKMRDFWMPFAPILLEDKQDSYLANPKEVRSPFMMLTYQTVRSHINDMAAALHPADRTARAQLLPRGHNPPVEALLEEFERLTGRAVLLNTSFNIHGEAMVSSVAQAVSVLRRSGLNWLWLDEVLLRKSA